MFMLCYNVIQESEVLTGRISNQSAKRRKVGKGD